MGSLSLSLYTIPVATFILLGITHNLLLPSLVTAVTHCRCDDVWGDRREPAAESDRPLLQLQHGRGGWGVQPLLRGLLQPALRSIRPRLRLLSRQTRLWGYPHRPPRLDSIHSGSLWRIFVPSNIPGSCQSKGIWNQVSLLILIPSFRRFFWVQDAWDCEKKSNADHDRNFQDVWFHPTVDGGQWTGKSWS